MEERKNTVLLIVIAIATLVVAVVGATFAYFASSTTNNGNLVVNATTGATATFTSSSSDTILLDVTSENMQKLAGTYNVSATSNGNIVIEYTAGGTKATSCTYDIEYVWEDSAVALTATAETSDIYQYIGNSGYAIPYTDTATSTKYDHEFSLNATASVAKDPTEKTSTPFGDTGDNYLANETEKELITLGSSNLTKEAEENETAFAERKANDLKTKTRRTVIKNAVIWADNNKNTITYNITANFYNLPVNQTLYANKTFKGHFEVIPYC